MNVNGKKQKKQVAATNSAANNLSESELNKRIASVEANIKAFTWEQLEINGKFTKNDKLAFISDDTLIIGCDVGSDTHYLRAIDTRGRELSKDAYPFANSAEGFQNARNWALRIAAEHDKKKLVLGLEPTGHYWFCLAAWMISNGISVVQVNPYAVKQTKEVEDNSQMKDDRKDPKVIANLVKDGNYGMPYLPENLYADLRRLSMLRDQLIEDRIRNINRLHREMKIYFPEYIDAFGNIDGAFSLEILRQVPLPEDILALGFDGLREIWRKVKLRGCGYNKAESIMKYAAESVGLRHGTSAGKEAIKWFASQILEISAKLKEVEMLLHTKCCELPNAENILEIEGIGSNLLTGILAEMGDIARFDEAKEIQKLSGLGIVACSSGKHQGETKISYRGRKRLRYWLFQAARSVVVHAEEFTMLHKYYTTRPDHPLKNMQSLIAIACKLLRIIFALLRTGNKYTPDKMLNDIRRPNVA